MATSPASGKKKTTIAGIVIAILIGGYSLVRPAVNDAMQWNLPTIAQTASNTTNDSAANVASNTTDGSAATDESLEYGLLREVSQERFVSPAGLLYTPGSAEGHRLEHLRRHTADQPGRPGKHGVFDGGMEGALKTIDQAYENAKAGKRTSKNTDQGRTIYIVDMGKRVGYVGGRDGNRQRQPMARRVQLILEGNRVITAYPL